MRRPYRNRDWEPRTIAAAVEQVGATLAPATTLALAQRCWKRAVGAPIAARAEPVSERAGKLTIACSDSVWAADLELQGSDLLGRMNAALGEAGHAARVTSLRFVVAPSA